MRTIFEKVTIASGQTLTTSDLRPGARTEGWRLWDGILRIVTTSDNATVRLRSSITDEDIDAVNTTPGGKSGAEIKIPGVYYLVVDTVGAAGVTVSVYLDGDTGSPPKTVTVA